MSIGLIDLTQHYNWDAIEKFGECSDITLSNGVQITEVGPWKINQESIKYWKEHCRRFKRPYVVYAGRAKPEIANQVAVEQKISLVRYHIYSQQVPRITIKYLVDMTSYDEEFIKLAAEKMLKYKQIEVRFDADGEFYLKRFNISYLKPKRDANNNIILGPDGSPVMVDTSAVGSKYKPKKPPVELKEEVCVLMRLADDFKYR